MCLYPTYLYIKKRNGQKIGITADCGKCIECTRKRANAWAARIVAEANAHSENCCITLTYDNEHIPPGELLNRKDMTDFLKRFRARIYPQKIRYFYCGEYGEKKGRPHYHLIVFGWSPSSDINRYGLEYSFRKGNTRYYRCSFLSDLWKNGFVTIDPDVSRETAFYCSLYMQKYTKSDKEVPVFNGMSLKPPIGFCEAEKNVYGRQYQGGRKVPPNKALRRSLVNRGVLSQFEADMLGSEALSRRELAICRKKPIPPEVYYSRIREIEQTYGYPFNQNFFSTKLHKSIDKCYFV